MFHLIIPRRKERKKENGYAETKRQEKVLGQGALRVPGNFDDRLLSGGDTEPDLTLFSNGTNSPETAGRNAPARIPGFLVRFFTGNHMSA